MILLSFNALIADLKPLAVWWHLDVLIFKLVLSSSHFSSVAQLCLTFCHPMDWNTPDFSVHHQLPEFAQTHVHRVGDTIQSYHSLLSPSLPPSVFPSIRVFSCESVFCIRWPKDWSFSFIISPANEYSGLISFRIDWFDLLVVQGTLKSLLQYCSLKASKFYYSIKAIPSISEGFNILWKSFQIYFIILITVLTSMHNYFHFFNCRHWFLINWFA